MNTKINKISTRLLILSVLLTVFVLPAAAQTTLSVQATTSVAPGGTVTIPITATAPVGGNIAGVDITLTYDPAIIIVPVGGVTSTAFPTLVPNINNATGTTRIVAVNIAGVTGTMTIANVQFNAVGAAGNTSSLTITVNLNGLTDSNGVVLTPTITNGVVTVTAAGGGIIPAAGAFGCGGRPLRVIDESTPEGVAALNAGPCWDAQSFGGFWYDLDDGLTSESLQIRKNTTVGGALSNSDRTIPDRDTLPGGGMVYNSAEQFKRFELNKHDQTLFVERGLNCTVFDASGKCQAGAKVSGVTGGTHYGKLGWMAEEFVAVNGKSKKLAKLLIEQKESAAEKKTLTIGESWQIGDWTLTAVSIDAKATPRQALLELSYKGQKLDTKIVNQGQVYTYIEKSIAGESDVPMFVTLIDSVFAGTTSDIVQLRFTWAIGRDVTEIKDGDIIGVFKAQGLTDAKLHLENDASVDLSRASTVTLARNFVFKVADDKDLKLRFAPDVIITQPGTYDVRGAVVDESTAVGQAQLNGTTNPGVGPFWNAQNFQGFWYDLDDGLFSENLTIRVTTLTNNQRTIPDRDSFPGGGMTYDSVQQFKQFELNKHDQTLSVERGLNCTAFDASGKCQAAAKASGVTGGTHYGKLGWMAEEFVAVNGKAKKLGKLLIEQKESASEKKTLTIGESWQIGDWTLTAVSIDAKATPRQALLELSYKGQKLDTKIVNQGQVYTYIEKSIAGESDVPMFVTLIDSVFAGTTSDIVQLRFTWAISRDITEVKDGDIIGVFKAQGLTDTRLHLENDASVDLSRASTITLAREFKFKVADDKDNHLRFYPMVERTVGGVPTGTETPGITGTAGPGPNQTVTVAPTPIVTTPPPGTATPPLQPTPTPTPTPTVPGFEAVFAIAGLLAVAYLVLRQRK